MWDGEDGAIKNECWIDVEESVLSSSDNELEAYTAVNDFSFILLKGWTTSNSKTFLTAAELKDTHSIIYGVCMPLLMVFKNMTNKSNVRR